MLKTPFQAAFSTAKRQRITSTLVLADRRIPTYQSRKTVRALRITDVQHVSEPEHGILLYLEGVPTPQFIQANAYIHRTPHAGMFWLGHEDGEMTFIEPDAFAKDWAPL